MVLHLLKRVDIQTCFFFQRLCVAGYAKKSAGGKAVKKKIDLEVETDPKKLCNYLCGGNIYNEGEDPKLEPDSEYPEWLWELKTTRDSPQLSELDPETKEYWRKLKKLNMDENNRQNKLRKKIKVVARA